MDRVNWVIKDCLNAIGRLAQLGPRDHVQPEVVHTRLRALVDAMLRKAREAGYGDHDARAMAYSIVALADEVMLGHTGPLRDYWMTQPLQLVYFGENTAGETFFTHLERLRGDPQRLDALRVYYTCLLYGFQGRYGVRGGEVALSDLIESLRAQLCRALPMPEVLAPNGPRPEEGVIDASRRFPVVWMALGLLALSAVLYLGLQVSLHEQLKQFASWMQSVTGS